MIADRLNLNYFIFVFCFFWYLFRYAANASLAKTTLSHYDVLGVKHDADQTEIRKAFIKLSKEVRHIKTITI